MLHATITNYDGAMNIMMAAVIIRATIKIMIILKYSGHPFSSRFLTGISVFLYSNKKKFQHQILISQ